MQPPLLTDDLTLVSAETGLFGLDASTGALRWHAAFGQSFSGGALAEGTLHVGNFAIRIGQAQVTAVDALTGAERWNFPTAGRATGLVAEDGFVFVGTANPPGSREGVLYAIDAVTGEKHWSLVALGQINRPAFKDGGVYFGSLDDTVRAVRVEDGVELWRVDLGRDVLSPAVVDDFVYVESAGTLFAVDAHTGDEHWRYETGAFTSLPAVDDDHVYVTGSGHHSLDALDAETGDLVWSFPADDELRASSVGGGAVYVGSGDGTHFSVDTRIGALRWQIDIGTPLATTSPGMGDGIIYLGTGSGGEMTAVAGSEGSNGATGTTKPNTVRRVFGAMTSCPGARVKFPYEGAMWRRRTV